MIKRLDLQFSIATIILFIILQLATILFKGNQIEILGIIHYIFLGSFIVTFLISRIGNFSQIYFLILIYQFLLVGVLFQFFLFEYKNPLGFNPIDAAFYHELATTLSKMDINDSVVYLSDRLDLSDFGYPFVLQGIYRISGSNPFIIAKIFNIFFHLMTCYYLVKISNFLFSDSSVAKALLILYGFNPATIFFISSGLKEPLFALVVVLAFYFLLKAFFLNSKLNYIWAIVAIIVTGLFRSAYPILIVLSLVVFTLLNTEGKYKRFKQIGLLSIGSFAMVGAYVFFQVELTQKMNYNFDSIVEHKLGFKPGKLDYLVMLIGGIIGPFPSFNYIKENQLGLLQTVGNFIKIIFSYFFIVGAYLALKNRFRLLYVGLIFILLNVIILVAVAASLDYRFLYPFMPLYFLIMAYGYNNYNRSLLPISLKSPIYLIAIFILIILYNYR